MPDQSGGVALGSSSQAWSTEVKEGQLIGLGVSLTLDASDEDTWLCVAETGADLRH